MASNSNSISLNVGDAIEYTESTTVTLEWTLRGLKQLFDSSKGEMKSKVTKSVKFGGGRWQVLFYANSGHEGGNYVSLYLSCEPAEDEKERSVNGKWIREGLFKFSFEIRNVNRGALTSPKEACDHSFSYKTANWGWAQFAKRDAVFYTPNTVRHVDAFLVICNITSASAAPSAVSPTPVRTVPRGLLDAVGDMLDDPTYSDVCFVLPAKKRRGVRGKVGKPKTIYAARKILQRVDYFHTSITDSHNAGKISNGAYRRSYRGADSISLSVASGDYGYDHEDNQEDDYDGYTDYWSQDPFEDSDEDSSDEEFDASGDHDPPSNHQEAVIADVDEESPDPQTPSNTHFPISTTESHFRHHTRSFSQSFVPTSVAPDSSSAHPRLPRDRNLTMESFRNSIGSTTDGILPSYTQSPSLSNLPPISPRLQEERPQSRRGTMENQDLSDTRDDVSDFTTSETVRGRRSVSDTEDNTTLSTRSIISPSEDGDIHIIGKEDTYSEPSARPIDPASGASHRETQVIGATNRRALSAGDLSASQRSGRYADDLKRSSGFAPRNRSGPKKTKVIVKECEYATYYAVLYYLYTDSIVFSPLTSDFTSKSTSASPTGLQNLPDTVRSSSSGSPYQQHLPAYFQSQPILPLYGVSQSHHQQIVSSQTNSRYPLYGSQTSSRRQGVGVGGEGFESPHRSRKEWIRSWAATNPGRPRPCSAKACYRLADKLGLTELKARAFQHIVKSLSVNNISFEIFSSFSAAFEDVRKVQVDFFLANWSEIKSSEAMRDVFRQVRLGRHPGFGMCSSSHLRSRSVLLSCQLDFIEI
ncbi:uncharacterized protein EI90DRAFT_938964 [Cantharellus anzutake]|uniref:uncharacterized protein n=1 Tax=Cantharellus anzutake TaxID=1750568 RepID=UPI001906BF3A|nr:uncharacterized protein EI90DRAFT_938964 [Cantharellus anzutake]KAF8311665.1 hypothetical protein EI90DRAFT_938964 [Cantharellus anzutake]